MHTSWAAKHLLVDYSWLLTWTKFRHTPTNDKTKWYHDISWKKHIIILRLPQTQVQNWADANTKIKNWRILWSDVDSTLVCQDTFLYVVEANSYSAHVADNEMKGMGIVEEGSSWSTFVKFMKRFYQSNVLIYMCVSCLVCMHDKVYWKFYKILHTFRSSISISSTYENEEMDLYERVER